MPKRYRRVDWRDAPSTATPRNARNFNIMDKGIDDLDNAIEDVQGQINNLVVEGDSSVEAAQARNTYPTLKARLDTENETVMSQLRQIDNLKLNKNEVANVVTPKGNSLYSALPTSNNQIGDYYFCMDGNGVEPAGNYVWNGVAWYFGGTGDEGYNMIRNNISGQYIDIIPTWTLGSITTGVPWDTNKGIRTEWPTKVNKGDSISFVNTFSFNVIVGYYIFTGANYTAEGMVKTGTMADKLMIDYDCYIGFRIMTQGDVRIFSKSDADSCNAIIITRNKVDYYSQLNNHEAEISRHKKKIANQYGYTNSEKLFDYAAHGYDGAGLYINNYKRVGSRYPFFITDKTKLVVESDNMSINLLYGTLRDGVFVFSNSTGYINGKFTKILEPSETRAYLLSARYVGEDTIPDVNDFNKNINFFTEDSKLYKLNDFSGLNKNLNNGFIYDLDLFNITQGGYDGAGIATVTNTRIRSDGYFNIDEDIIIKNTNKNLAANLIVFDKTKNNLQVNQWGWKKGLFEVYVPKNVNYSYKLTISFVNENGSIDGQVISLSDFFKNIKIYRAHDYVKVPKNELPGDWKKEINSIQKMQGTNFSFAVQTDTHFTDYESYLFGTNMKNLTHYLGLDFICNLGDMVRGYEYDSTESMRNAISDIMERYTNGVSCPFLYALGNHEDNVMYTTNSTVGSGNHSIDEVILHDELYAKIMKPVKNTIKINQPNKSFYYYVDYDDIRVIVLNTRDIDWIRISATDINVSRHCISMEQIDWLSDEALNTLKPILVMCHVPLHSGLTTSSVVNGQLTLNKITNFKNNGGNVIGICHGHTHKQDSALVDGINHIVFANGGAFAEVVIVNTLERKITTKIIGEYGTKTNRTFTF